MSFDLVYDGKRYTPIQGYGTYAPEAYTPLELKDLRVGTLYEAADLRLLYLGFDWMERLHHFASPDIGTTNHLTFPTDSIKGFKQIDNYDAAGNELVRVQAPPNLDWRDPAKVIGALYQGQGFYNPITDEQVIREPEDRDISEDYGFETALLIKRDGLGEAPEFYNGILQAPLDRSHDETVSLMEIAQRISSELGWGPDSERRVLAGIRADSACYDDEGEIVVFDTDDIAWQVNLNSESGIAEVWARPVSDGVMVALSGPGAYTDAYSDISDAKDAFIALAAVVAGREHGHLVEHCVQHFIDQSAKLRHEHAPKSFGEWRDRVLREQKAAWVHAPKALAEKAKDAIEQMPPSYKHSPATPKV